MWTLNGRKWLGARVTSYELSWKSDKQDTISNEICKTFIRLECQKHKINLAVKYVAFFLKLDICIVNIYFYNLSPAAVVIILFLKIFENKEQNECEV